MLFLSVAASHEVAAWPFAREQLIGLIFANATMEKITFSGQGGQDCTVSVSWLARSIDENLPASVSGSGQASIASD